MMTVDSAIMTRAEFAAWEARADVLYHFYAYHYFDQGPHHANSIDLVNLDDADVQYFKRVADQVFQFAGQHRLVKYLKDEKEFKLPGDGKDEFGYDVSKESAVEIKFMLQKQHEDGLTMRESLVRHVRLYNLTQEPRRRFFLIGLSSDDVGFLASLVPDHAELTPGEFLNGNHPDNGTAHRPLTMATDGCMGPVASGQCLDTVEKAVEKFITSRLPGASNGNSIMLEHSRGKHHNSSKQSLFTTANQTLKHDISELNITYAQDKIQRSQI